MSELEPPGVEEDDVTTFSEHKDGEVAKDTRVVDAASPKNLTAATRSSPIPEESADATAPPSPKEDSNTSSPSSKGTASSSSSPSSKDEGKGTEEEEEEGEGPEADPLIAPESPERGEEAL